MLRGGDETCENSVRRGPRPRLFLFQRMPILNRIEGEGFNRESRGWTRIFTSSLLLEIPKALSEYLKSNACENRIKSGTANSKDWKPLRSLHDRQQIIVVNERFGAERLRNLPSKNRRDSLEAVLALQRVEGLDLEI